MTDGVAQSQDAAGGNAGSVEEHLKSGRYLTGGAAATRRGAPSAARACGGVHAAISDPIDHTTVAVLFARRDSNYKALTGVDVWDEDRDARNWPGGSPLVAHPPCKSWSVLKNFAKAREGERDLAPWAVEQVRRWGGVLEHPKGSALWPHCGLPAPGERDKFGGWTKPVLQMWWGHRAEKPTLLYIVGVAPRELPAVPMQLGDAPRVLFNKRGLRAGMPGFRAECTRAEREHTPPDMAEWLVAVARKAHNVRGNAGPTAPQN